LENLANNKMASPSSQRGNNNGHTARIVLRDQGTLERDPS